MRCCIQFKQALPRVYLHQLTLLDCFVYDFHDGLDLRLYTIRKWLD